MQIACGVKGHRSPFLIRFTLLQQYNKIFPDHELVMSSLFLFLFFLFFGSLERLQNHSSILVIAPSESRV